MSFEPCFELTIFSRIITTLTWSLSIRDRDSPTTNHQTTAHSVIQRQSNRVDLLHLHLHHQVRHQEAGGRQGGDNPDGVLGDRGVPPHSGYQADGVLVQSKLICRRRNLPAGRVSSPGQALMSCSRWDWTTASTSQTGQCPCPWCSSVAPSRGSPREGTISDTAQKCLMMARSSEPLVLKLLQFLNLMQSFLWLCHLYDSKCFFFSWMEPSEDISDCLPGCWCSHVLKWIFQGKVRLNLNIFQLYFMFRTRSLTSRRSSARWVTSRRPSPWSRPTVLGDIGWLSWMRLRIRKPRKQVKVKKCSNIQSL